MVTECGPLRGERSYFLSEATILLQSSIAVADAARRMAVVAGTCIEENLMVFVALGSAEVGQILSDASCQRDTSPPLTVLPCVGYVAQGKFVKQQGGGWNSEPTRQYQKPERANRRIQGA